MPVLTRYRIPFLSGNRTPQDHTQVGPPDEDVWHGDDDSNPDEPHVNFNVEMALAWRIRSFTFEGSWEGQATRAMRQFQGTTGDPPVAVYAHWTIEDAFTFDFPSQELSAEGLNGNLIYPPHFPGEYFCHDERDMMGSYNGWGRPDATHSQPWGDFEWSRDSDGDPPYVGAIHLSDSMGAGVGCSFSAYPEFDLLRQGAGFEGDPWIPTTFISGSLPGGSHRDPFMFALLIDFPWGSDYDGFGTFTIDPGLGLPSIDVPIAVIVDANPMFGETTSYFKSGSGDFTATASSYWPYCNSHGDPIYNEGDGSVLYYDYSSDKPWMD